MGGLRRDRSTVQTGVCEWGARYVVVLNTNKPQHFIIFRLDFRPKERLSKWMESRLYVYWHGYRSAVHQILANYHHAKTKTMMRGH